MPERPDPANWDEPRTRRFLAVRNITEVYRALLGMGFSQHQISRLTGQSQSEVSEILKGRRVVAYGVLRRIAAGLGIPYGHMGLAYTDAEGNIVAYPGEEGERDPDPLEDDDVITRRVLGMVSVAMLGEAALDGPIMQLGTNLLGESGGLPLLTGPSGKLEKHHVGWIRTATEYFWELEHELGGKAVHAAVRGLAEQVVGALQDSPPDRELYAAASDLCRMAAWAAFDAGHHRGFWQCHTTALDLARESGDTALIIMTVLAAGRVHILLGRPRDAAKLFELTVVRKAPDAIGWGLLGCAYAPGNPDAARHVLMRLQDAPDADTLDAVALTAHVRLGLKEYSAAVAAYEQVLPNRSGQLAVVETAPMAMAHLQSGELSVGLRYAEQALDLNDKMRSRQCGDAVRRLGTVLAAQKDSTAQDLAQRAAEAAQAA